MPNEVLTQDVSGVQLGATPRRLVYLATFGGDHILWMADVLLLSVDATNKAGTVDVMVITEPQFEPRVDELI